MEITFRAGKLKRKKFRIDKRTSALIREVSSIYNLPEEEVVLKALTERWEKESKNERVETLRNEIDALLAEMFELEGKWASVRYRSHTYVKENRGLAIVLAGKLGENKSLRNLLKKKRAHDDIRKVVDFYLWL